MSIMSLELHIKCEWHEFTHLTKTEYRCNGIGPFAKTISAVSANPSDGVLVFLQILCEVSTFFKHIFNCFKKYIYCGFRELTKI